MATTKLISLALSNLTEDWARATPYWKSAMDQFAIFFQSDFLKLLPKFNGRFNALLPCANNSQKDIWICPACPLSNKANTVAAL
ncbi:UNVERIFIED_CONTAM: hypothetical protein NO986_00570 [Comamonas sp. A-3]